MYQSKLICSGEMDYFEKELNSFLGQIQEGKLVDVKYVFEAQKENSTYSSDVYSALVIYRK